jgi:hypothetical protein
VREDVLRCCLRRDPADLDPLLQVRAQADNPHARAALCCGRAASNPPARLNSIRLITRAAHCALLRDGWAVSNPADLGHALQSRGMAGLARRFRPGLLKMFQFYGTGSGSATDPRGIQGGMFLTVQSSEQRKRQGTDAAPSPRGTPGRSTSASRTPRGSPSSTPGGTRASWEGNRCRVVHATLAAFTAVKRC